MLCGRILDRFTPYLTTLLCAVPYIGLPITTYSFFSISTKGLQ